MRISVHAGTANHTRHVWRTDMKTVAKTTLLAATAAMVAAASPAEARPGNRGHDGIDAGDVIAGALIIGGIAAIASAADNDRGYDRRYDDRRYDDRYRGGRGYGYDNGGYGYYNNGYDSRTAVDQCIRAASREASRTGRARVTDVTSINRIRGGYEIKGRLVVEQRGYWGGRDSGWNRYGNRYDNYRDGYDKGRFSCVSYNGRVDGVRLSGLRGYY